MTFENTWQNQDGKSYETILATSLLGSYALTRRKGTDRDESLSWFQLSAKVSEDIRSGSVRELNTDVYFALGSPIAQQRAADKARWESLPKEEQLAIVESVAEHHESEFVRKLAASRKLDNPGLRLACIAEMKRRLD